MAPELVTATIEVILAIGVVVFAYAQWRNGKMQGVSNEIVTAGGTIDLLQKSVSVLRGELDETNTKLLKEHDEIIRLQEQLKHKDEQLQQYLQILQNRNPELDAFIKYMTQIAKDSAEYMKTTSVVLKEMQAVLQKGTLIPLHE